MTDQRISLPTGTDWAQLDRYFAGESTPSERQVLEQQFRDTPDVLAVVTALRASARVDASLIENITNHVLASTLTTPNGNAAPVATTRPSNSSSARPWWGRPMMAWGLGLWAVVVLAMGVSATTGFPDFATPARADLLTYITPNGEQATLHLEDGTTVVLNSGSRIDLARQFGKSNRTIHLQGEAYFRVIHATRVPFIVKTGAISTRVLGTEFGVRAYDAKDVRVAVSEGRVSVNTTVLDARDIGYATPDGKVAVAHHQDVAASLAFTQGKLVLRTMSLYDAIADLNRWYNADIRLHHSGLGALRIDAVLNKGSIDDLAEMLQETFHVSVTREGQTLHVYSR